jgi:hypothetical protein
MFFALPTADELFSEFIIVITDFRKKAKPLASGDQASSDLAISRRIFCESIFDAPSGEPASQIRRLMEAQRLPP